MGDGGGGGGFTHPNAHFDEFAPLGFGVASATQVKSWLQVKVGGGGGGAEQPSLMQASESLKFPFMYIASFTHSPAVLLQDHVGGWGGGGVEWHVFWQTDELVGLPAVGLSSGTHRPDLVSQWYVGGGGGT